MSKKFYITTPIYYVNARPHIGHAYTTIACDTIARRQRMLGAETFFLTGTDEHGQKIERAAQAAGKTPQQLTDEVSAEFRALWDRMGLTYDDYIRTTSDKHKRGVQELVRRIRDNGYIYKGRYTGQYCVFDELYVDAVGPGAPCPECGRPTETVEEENYFFKLSAFQDKLIKLYTEQPDFIRPETRRNEVMSFVRSGLRDLSISRSTFAWGIPVPDDPKHVIYVWLDALANYVTALGFGSPDTTLYDKFWPADLHMIGKEIVRFHCVYWPAFLMAAGLPLPHGIMAHGWLLFEENKMSKSRGNIVRAETILDVLGADALRYFLLREIVFGQDGSFSFDALVQRYNADLANGLGNLASRTLTMITRYFRGEVPYPSHTASHTRAEDAIADTARKVIAECGTLFDEYQFSRALETAWGLVAAVDKYIVENEPWALGEKRDEASLSRLATVLYTSAEALRIVTALAHPVIPEATAKIWSQLGLGDIKKFPLSDLKWGQLKLGGKLGRVEPVFPRADKSAIERMQKLEEREVARATEAVSAAEPARAAGATFPADPTAPTAAARPSAIPADGKISIDDFAKIELRVGQVKVAEKVEGADKLLRLEVDLGTEVRQVVAGIAEAYAPETLIGRKVVIVANLAPRKLRGLESNGMIVAASAEGGKPVLCSFLEDVPVGTRLK
ncbi:MAG: methionine--tRNA ligase [Acidobacteria bacterium]|nr:MAG: methionine--tRNA ligase [Acidobacteriales bacterium 13_2_20CM_2_55_5]PYX04054.1 MAG: methionine--tRNA ligase [Acidobacteriota bacterium]PYX13796.1 MAG: methionine--tRNA ligase [Acidobacteriota bacterium]